VSRGCTRSWHLGAFVVGSVLSGCTQRAVEHREDPASATSSTTYTLVPTASAPSTAPTDAVNPVDAASPSPAIEPSAPGVATPSCVNGWTTPERGSALRGAVLNMLRTRPGERFVVTEMRYFVGPEDAEVISPRGDVERWYVKAYSEGDPRRRQRWLARRAAVGSGIDAIAPYDSVGYGASTWRRPDATDERFADPFERPCATVKAGERCMGLPREVLGCLSGT
jgi:hypothetical protein